MDCNTRVGEKSDRAGTVWVKQRQSSPAREPLDRCDVRTIVM